MRSTAGVQAGRRGHRRKDCSLSLAGFGSEAGRNLDGSLRRMWIVGSPACCMASGGRSDIEVLRAGWQLGCTWTAGVVCCKKSGIEEVVGDGLQEIGG